MLFQIQREWYLYLQSNLLPNIPIERKIWKLILKGNLYSVPSKKSIIKGAENYQASEN